MRNFIEKLEVADELENCLNEHFNGSWCVICKRDSNVVEIFHDNRLKHQISIDKLVSNMSVTDLLDHKLDITPKYPRVFVRWFEDEDTIKEYYFDVKGTLQEAEEVAKHLKHVMDMQGTKYISCYATTLYFV